MEVNVLIENQLDEHKDGAKFKVEHGLSLHINSCGSNILFDTGASGSFCDNAAEMGVDIYNIDVVVISHAHSDHAGGLIKFLSCNSKAKVYMSVHAVDRHYVKFGPFNIDVGVPLEIFEKFQDRIIFINKFTEILKNVYIVPNSTVKSFPAGKAVKKMLVMNDGVIQQDHFNHEISLVVKSDYGLEIFTGCSHNGISNMVENARSFFPSVPINTVIGGFHLMGIPFKYRLGETEDYIRELANRMNSLGIAKVYTAHCTGYKAYHILKEIMVDKIEYIHTGKNFML